MWFLFGEVSSSSGCLGWATLFYCGRPRKSWDEVIKNARKKLDMDSVDPQNRSEWRGRLRGRLVKKPNPR